MSSADDAIYAAEAGNVLSRLGGEVAQRQRRSEGIMTFEQAENQANSQAAAETTAQTEAEAGVGSGVAGAVGLTTGVVRGLIKAKRAARALSRVKGFLADKAAPGADEAPADALDPSRVRLAGEGLGEGEVGTQPTLQAGTSADVAAGQSAAEAADSLRGVQARINARFPDMNEPAAADAASDAASAPAAPAASASAAVEPVDDALQSIELGRAPLAAEEPAAPAAEGAAALEPAAADGPSDVQYLFGAGKEAAANLGDQLASKASSATDFLETAASKYGLKGANLGDLLGSSAEDLGELTGGIGADLSGGSSALVAAGGAALEALGPLSMFAGAGLGIYSAIEEGNQEATATANAAKYAADVSALSAAPELQTGSIAMPVQDSTAFRSGGITNF